MIDRINLRAVRLVLFAVTVAVLAILTADRADAADTIECHYGGGQVRPECIDWQAIDHDDLATKLGDIQADRARQIDKIIAAAASRGWHNVDWRKLDADLTRAQHDAATRAANTRGAAYCGSVEGTWSPYTAAYDDTTETGGVCIVGPAPQATADAAPPRADCSAYQWITDVTAYQIEPDDSGNCEAFTGGPDNCRRVLGHWSYGFTWGGSMGCYITPS